MFQDASFTVSCCKIQHSLSTRKDCHFMRHATPCIRPATFISALQLHACDMQLHAFALQPLHAPCKLMHAPCKLMHAPCNLCMCHANSCMHHATPCMCHAPFACNISETEKASKQLNQSDASIIKVFDFCLATAHVFRNHCAVELCTHALCTCCQL